MAGTQSSLRRLRKLVCVGWHPRLFGYHEDVDGRDNAMTRPLFKRVLRRDSKKLICISRGP
jgi:hypothetical protein